MSNPEKKNETPPSVKNAEQFIGQSIDNINNNSSLFNNPAVNNAIKSLTPQQLKEYQAFGEHMFKTDFVGENGDCKPLSEAAAYIIQALKSGLEPSDINDDEKRVMQEVYGDNWKSRNWFE